MSMRRRGLFEACSLLRLLVVGQADQACQLQCAVDGGGADGHDVTVDHHVCEAAITFERMVEMKGDDRLAFPVLKPEISRDRGVVMVGLAVAFAPLVETLARDADPASEARDRHAGSLRIVANEADNLVTNMGLDPDAHQSSPTFFLLR